LTTGVQFVVYGGAVNWVLRIGLPGAEQSATASNPPVQTSGAAIIQPRFEPTLGGYLNEPPATNVYLNSQSPATQTITVTAQQYVLSFYGTGSIAMTGTYTGTLSGTGANNLVQLPFTPTAGALVLTDTGSLANVQVEAGSVATSRIITYGAPVTRAADSLSAPLSQFPWLVTPQGFTVSGDFSTLGTNPVNVVPFAVTGTGGYQNSAYPVTSVSNGLAFTKTVASTTQLTSYGTLNAAGVTNVAAMSVTPAGVTGSLNHKAAVSVANAGWPALTTLSVGGIGVFNTFAGHISAITLRAGPTPSAALQGMQ
jgi:hypothetical protein